MDETNVIPREDNDHVTRGAFRRRVDAVPAWGRWLMLGLLFLLLSSVLTARYVYVHTAISPIDEYNYIDAVDKASQGIVAREGQTVGQEARTAASCLGFGFEQREVTFIGTCGQNTPLSAYPWDGHSTAAIHSPVYYFTTAWMAKGIMLVVPGLHLITAARLTGAIWLAAGMLALAYLLHRGGASRAVVAALPVLVAAMPGFRATNAYISPDAPNLLCGSLVFLAAYLYARREWSWWPFTLIAMAVTLVKFQNSFAVVAAAIFLLWHRLMTRGSEQQVTQGPTWWSVFVPVVAALAVGVGWLRLKSLIAIPGVHIQGIDPTGGVNLAGSTFYADDSLLGLFTGNWPASTPASVFPNIVLWAGIAGLVATAWLIPGAAAVRRHFAQAGALSLLTIGPAVNIAFAAVFGTSVAMQPRYAMVLIPLLVFPMGWVLRTRGLKVATVLLAVSAYLYAVLLLRVN